MQESFQTLRHKTAWSCILPTEQNASLVFKTMARVEAAIFDLLLRRYSTYPLRLLDLLLEPRSLEVTEEAEISAVQLLTAPSCCLDTFSEHIRTVFPNVRALMGLQCQALLRVTLQTIVGTTFRVETLHSVNLRRLKARAMSHGITVSDVALTHTAVCAPLSVATLEAHAARRTRKAEKVPSAKKDKGSETEQKRRGGGGSWRAFLHTAVAQEGAKKGFKKAADFSQQYQNLSVDERRRLKDIGKAATALHREGLDAFPATARAARASLLREDSVETLPPPLPPTLGFSASAPSAVVDAADLSGPSDMRA